MDLEGSLLCWQERTTGPILSQMHSLHTFPQYFRNIHFNIILPSAPRSSEWSGHYPTNILYAAQLPES
jgi:hypothetical protein